MPINEYIDRLLLVKERIGDKIDEIVDPTIQEYNRAGLSGEKWRYGEYSAHHDGLQVEWEEEDYHSTYVDRGRYKIPWNILDPDTRSSAIADLKRKQKEQASLERKKRRDEQEKKKTEKQAALEELLVSQGWTPPKT